MREKTPTGISILMTMVLPALLVLPRPLSAEEPVFLAAVVAGETAAEPLVEPINDLPNTPGPHIDSITLFPNQGEITSPAALGDQRFGYVLHGEARAAYESNLFIQPTNEQEDFIFTVSPGVSVGWGDFKGELEGANSFRAQFERYVGKNYFYVDYAPSYTWYADHERLNSFDHDARLQAEWMFQRLSVGVRARYFTQTLPDPDVGTRVEVDRLSAALTTRYEYTGKTSFEVNGYFDSITYGGDQVDTREWRNEDWANYQVSPKVTLSAGGAVAAVERSSGPSQTFERGLMRAQYEATEKLTLSLTGGAEWRQTEGGDDRADGIFMFDAGWDFSERAYLRLEGYRRTISSGAIGENDFLATGAHLEFRQQIRQRFYVGLAGGYQNSDYDTIAAVRDGDRADDLYFVRPSVGMDVTRWLNCVISAEYRQNDSTRPNQTFEASTATVRFNLLF